MLYELLRLVQEHKLFLRNDPISKTPGYPDFKSFFEATLKKPFTQWAELEATYHFVSLNCPEVLQKTYTEALTLVQQRRQRLEEASEDRRVGNGANKQPGDTKFSVSSDSRHGVQNRKSITPKIDTRLRAIKRAPQVVRQLYENDLIGEKQAAKLGTIKQSEEKRIAVQEIIEKLEKIPIEAKTKEERKLVKREVNQLINQRLSVFNSNVMNDPAKAAQAIQVILKRFEGEKLRKLIELLREDLQ